jgi:uncharacterized protein YndB with AHSA1/START domain
MKTLNFSIFIQAPRKRVWDTMLQDATYRQWTKSFNETSYYEGDWSEGSKMLFLGTDAEGKVDGGMVSRIAKNMPLEYVSIQHVGMIMKGVEETWADDMRAYENYSFVEKDGGTQVNIELTNIQDEWAQMMSDMWPKALEALKTLAEA